MATKDRFSCIIDTNFRKLKRRKLNSGDDAPQQPSTFNTGQVTMPTPEVTIPVPILYAESPQDLAFAILTSDKFVYTKQELLLIVNKMHQMLAFKFDGECSYIG